MTFVPAILGLVTAKVNTFDGEIAKNKPFVDALNANNAMELMVKIKVSLCVARSKHHYVSGRIR